MRRNRLTIAITVAMLSLVPAACSSSTSPKDAFCNDAATLKSGVGTLLSEVKAGNFGEAKDQLSTVQADYQALRSSAKELADSQQSTIKSDLDTIKETFASLSSATSLDELKSTLATLESQITEALATISDTLDC